MTVYLPRMMPRSISRPMPKASPVLSKLLAFDQKLRLKYSSPSIIGVDEVGRGCLAGPVVAAAVILPPIKLRTTLATALEQLNDSKKLSSEKRERLSSIITEHAAWAIAEASVEEIDNINILQASLMAMQRAVTQLLNALADDSAFATDSALVAVDGNKLIPKIQCEQISIIKGDGLSASIAAASVIAKVYRDQLMRDLSKSLPVYDWHKNKGYGSSDHIQAIRSYGVSIWHRRVFTEKLLADQNQLKLAPK